MKRKLNLTLAMLLSLGLVGCGSQLKDDDKNSDSESQIESQEDADSMVQDFELQDEALSASLADATEALSDGNVAQAEGLSLAGVIAIRDDSRYERSCVEREDHAIVTLTAEIDRDQHFRGRRHRYDRKVTGSGKMVRDWSKKDSKVKCDDRGKYAAIDWKSDVTGLHLDVEFNRERKVAKYHKNRRNGRDRKIERSFSAEGTRTIDWLTHKEEDGLIYRSKSIVSDVTRNHKRANSQGDVRELTLVVKTAEDAPLNVSVERQSEDLALKKKTIDSGKIIVTRDRDGRIEASFAGLSAEFKDDGCQFVDGKVTLNFYRADSDEPVKSFEFKIEDGDYVLTNLLTGEIREDFEFEGCNIRKFVR